ncbi:MULTISPECIES: FtsX-like permease family protein [unclassified Streptomyces]|uniref:FtsX-like permease family protein n=1 Tax=unclassified Streptomyces TaxID=2593676 RepID=UPI000FFE377D|nr:MULTISPECIES: FtsX-like permease family protein [unclassified Streptomyces]
MNPVPAPWIRTRLRAAPAAACALALLVALTATLAAAFPRAVDRYEDAGLRRAVESARPVSTTLQVSAEQPGPPRSPERREELLRPRTLGEQYTQVLAAVPGPLVVDRGQSTYGVHTMKTLEAPESWLPRPSGLPPQFTLAAQHGLAGHAAVRSGRLPRADGHVTAATAQVEAAVTARTAKSLHIKVGSVIHLPGADRPPLAVRVTGIVTPHDPGGAWWDTEPLLGRPSLVVAPGPERDKYWRAGLLLAPDAAPALLGTAGNPWRYWQLAPSHAGLRGHDVDRLKSAVASVEAGPALRRIRERTDLTTTVSTDLDSVLSQYEELRGGVRPLVAVAAFGTGTVAAVVLLMAGGLAADRRRTELALLRARGASLRGLTGRLFAETAVVALPAGALGLGVALLALPGGRAAGATTAAATATALACAALPLRAAAVHRTVRIHGGRGDVTSVRPSRRRTVAELTLVVVALGAVETLRRRGASSDQLTSLAPVLVGVAAALLLVRVYPFPLRGLARPAARLRGAVGHLSLARAGRTSASAVLPLLALLTALTTAAFGGSVLAGVRDARDQAALLTVGADARIEQTSAMAPDLPDRIRRSPGVRALTAVSISYRAMPTDLTRTVPLAGVNPAQYAQLTARTGIGAFDAHDLTGGGHGDALPALASRTTAKTYGTRPFPVRLEDGTTITVRITAVRDRTPAVAGDNFLVVDRAALKGPAARPTALLLTGAHLDGPALRRAAPASADVQLRSEERASYADSPLQTGAERVYTAAVAAGAGYAVLALLLSLLRTIPERTALLARLRTMGLTRTQGRRLLILESLPQAVLAAAGGALTGWATIRLLSPGIDLTTIALASRQGPAGDAVLRTDALSLAVPAAAIVLVTVGVAGIQAWWTGRRGAVAELRAGDAR